LLHLNYFRHREKLEWRKKCHDWAWFRIWSRAQAQHIMFVPSKLLLASKEGQMKNKIKYQTLVWLQNQSRVKAWLFFFLKRSRTLV
jgi:hypothetical protein